MSQIPLTPILAGHDTIPQHYQLLVTLVYRHFTNVTYIVDLLLRRRLIFEFVSQLCGSRHKEDSAGGNGVRRVLGNKAMPLDPHSDEECEPRNV